MLGVSLKAEAADGDHLHPYIGTKHTYTINGLHNGDAIDFYVTAKDVDNTSTLPDELESVGSENVELSVSTILSVSDSKASTEITWKKMPASGTAYHLWVKATSEGCSNYRYIVITPINYVVDFVVYALGNQDNLTGSFDNTSTCIKPESDKYNLSVQEEGVLVGAAKSENGSTPLYFKVVRKVYNMEGGNLDLNNAWKFDVTFSSTTASDFSYTNGSQTITAGINEKIIQASVSNFTNVASLEKALSMSISNAKDIDGNQDDDNSTSHTFDDKNVAKITVNGIPAIGGFIFE